MKSTLPFLALIRLALSAAALAALVGQPALADGVKTVKLRIGVAITEEISPGDSVACPAIGHIVGSGYSTELGAVTVQATDCFVPDATTPGSFNFYTRPLTFVTLSTANGQLFGSYAGTATGAPYPIESISASLKISGGTGRYANASGSANIEGVENIGTMPAVGVLVISGRLSY